MRGRMLASGVAAAHVTAGVALAGAALSGSRLHLITGFAALAVGLGCMVLAYVEHRLNRLSEQLREELAGLAADATELNHRLAGVPVLRRRLG